MGVGVAARWRPRRVLLILLGPAGEHLGRRVIEDDGYAVPHCRPEVVTEARATLALADLEEWLETDRRPAGRYTLVAAEPNTDAGPGETWARVTLDWAGDRHPG